MIGTKLAHYEITSHLGSGGMGDVYQATDSKLGRSVAVKFLPEAFARDADRVSRFEREARVLASLNHPNIAAIYGLEDSDGKKFLVMELVPGETLAERITRGPVPVEDALGIAKQMAEALEAAHEKGHHPSGPEARQHQGDGRRQGQGARFRIGEGLPAGGRESEPVQLADHGKHAGRRVRAGDDSGNRGVHVSRTSQRARGGQAHGHLCIGLRAVRNADGKAGIRWR